MDKRFINNETLHKECEMFCSYLINQKPSKYVREKYQDAHIKGSIRLHTESGFDKLLMGAAVINPFFVKLVDVYTGLFSKRALFRKKLILLLAILESSAPSCHYLDSITTSNKAILFLKMFQNVMFFTGSLVLSIIIFMPLHLIFKTLFK